MYFFILLYSSIFILVLFCSNSLNSSYKKQTLLWYYVDSYIALFCIINLCFDICAIYAEFFGTANHHNEYILIVLICTNGTN